MPWTRWKSIRSSFPCEGFPLFLLLPWMCLVFFSGSLTTYGTKDKCSTQSNIVFQMLKFEISVHIWFHISSLKFRFVFLMPERAVRLYLCLHPLHEFDWLCCWYFVKKFKILSPLSWGAENVPFNKFNDWMNIWMKMIKLYTHACTHVLVQTHTSIQAFWPMTSNDHLSEKTQANRFLSIDLFGMSGIKLCVHKQQWTWTY